AMRAKAEAWEQYGRAAVTQLIVEKLPEIVANAAKSLETTQTLIIMGERGPSQLVGSVVAIAASAPALATTLTGMALSSAAGTPWNGRTMRPSGSVFSPFVGVFSAGATRTSDNFPLFVFTMKFSIVPRI